jgi:hypothetical protein
MFPPAAKYRQIAQSTASYCSAAINDDGFVGRNTVHADKALDFDFSNPHHVKQARVQS